VLEGHVEGPDVCAEEVEAELELLARRELERRRRNRGTGGRRDRGEQYGGERCEHVIYLLLPGR
jgi:hypothetical protein